MDRRQQKTQSAIFGAFRALLEEKRYDHITVQEIIDRANVGRSTFYAHFETKDLLLDALCRDLFEHVFEDNPCPYAPGGEDLEGQLAHILWHMTYFKARLKTVFQAHLSLLPAEVPKEFLLPLLTGSFGEMVRWWLAEGTHIPPETAAKYFMNVLEKH